MSSAFEVVDGHHQPPSSLHLGTEPVHIGGLLLWARDYRALDVGQGPPLVFGYYPECPLHFEGIAEVSTIRFVAHDESLGEEDPTFGIAGEAHPLFVVPYWVYHDVTAGHAFLLCLRAASTSLKVVEPHL